MTILTYCCSNNNLYIKLLSRFHFKLLFVINLLSVLYIGKHLLHKFFLILGRMLDEAYSHSVKIIDVSSQGVHTHIVIITFYQFHTTASVAVHNGYPAAASQISKRRVKAVLYEKTRPLICRAEALQIKGRVC